MDDGRKIRKSSFSLVTLLPLLPSLLCIIPSFFFCFLSREDWLYSPSPDFTMLLVSFFFFGFGLIYLIHGAKQEDFIDLLTERRILVIIIGGVFIIFFGGGSLISFKDYCSSVSQMECGTLWGTAIASILLTIFLLEAFVARRRARGKWIVQKADIEGDYQPIRTFPQSLFLSNLRMIIVTLLGGLPIIILGTLSSIFFGVGFGFGLAAFIHGVMNWLPPITENLFGTD
jgi:hypothetical protein